MYKIDKKYVEEIRLCIVRNEPIKPHLTLYMIDILNKETTKLAKHYDTGYEDVQCPTCDYYGIFQEQDSDDLGWPRTMFHRCPRCGQVLKDARYP